MKSAKDKLDLADADTNGNPIISDVTLSALAFGDALSIKFGGMQNTQDHSGIVRIIKKAMGDRVDDEQLKRLGRIMGAKSVAQYGFRPSTIAEAQSLYDQLVRFSDWAEKQLAVP